MDTTLVEKMEPETQPSQVVTTARLTTDKSKRDEFVEMFVAEFEAKLLAYHLAKIGLVEKPGKVSYICSETLGKVVGALSLGITAFSLYPPATAAAAKFGADAGKFVFKKLGDILGHRHYMKKVDKLENLVREFVENVEEFRIKLVENGFDIFQSFEMQFLMVANERHALKKLAKDSVNRAIDCLCESNLTIAECVILGKSKVRIGKTELPKIGFKIVYEWKSKEVVWRTGDLFDKAGIFIETDNSFQCFKKKDQKSETKKYFHRRLLTKENWEKMKESYDKDDAVKEEKFQYATSPADFNNDSLILLEKIKSRCYSVEINLEKLSAEYLDDIKKELNDLGFLLGSCYKELSKYATVIDGEDSDASLNPSVLIKHGETLGPYLADLDFAIALHEYFNSQSQGH